MRALNRFLKRLSRNRAGQAVLCWLASVYLRLVWRTSRWRTEGGDEARALWRDRRPFVMALWHGRMMMMTFAWNPPAGARTAPVDMLISDHPDGRFIARTIRHYGIASVAGSDSRQPAAAVRALVRALRAGRCIGITPDSPPGPRMRAKTGVVALARLSGVPVIPATFSITRRLVMEKSWDRMIVPLPFARGVFLWGDPIEIPARAGEAETEAARRRIEDTLNELSERADRLCGHAAIAPDPAPALGGAAEPVR